MIKARYIGVDNELLQSGKVYKIKTISVMWNGKPRLRVAFGERFRYWVHYGSLEEFLRCRRNHLLWFGRKQKTIDRSVRSLRICA